MLARVRTVGLDGIEAYAMEVEVDVAQGLPGTVVVGLPDAAVRESCERVKAAIKNSGYNFPPKKITVNLAPADRRKAGPVYDLPIAIGILQATGQIEVDGLESWVVLGELALDGHVRHARGCLSTAIFCREQEIRFLMVPEANAAEAAVVQGVDVVPVSKLSDAVGLLSGNLLLDGVIARSQGLPRLDREYDVDFADVKGQEHAKRALTIAAAGGHNVIMIGPPGAGKTMLARRLPTILPDLTPDESIETTRIHSVAGLLGAGQALVTTRPFRSPHHTISDAGLVGGGGSPRPGEASLAHNGVLFLDELPEFNRKALETLRQPLEDGTISISRASGSVAFPARFTLVCAMNPCPCGFHTDPARECHCTPGQIQKYLSRISGPLLDRIDIHIEVPPVRHRDLDDIPASSETSQEIRMRAERARSVQRERFRAAKIHCNAQMSARAVKKYCALDAESKSLLKHAATELALSARAYHKVLRVSRTIADLEAAETIRVEHVSEAVQYRSFEM